MGGKDKKSNIQNGSDERMASPDEVDAYIPTPPDGGWGWVIVASSLVCNIIVDGLGYTFGIFLLEFSKYFDAPKSTVALVGSMQVGTYLCVGPIASALTNKYGCRPVCMAGSVIATAGFILSTFSTSVEILILTYGVIGGFGFGMMYLPAIVSVGFYFEKKRAIATGIGVCGSGVGMFIFAPFSRFLIDNLDWKNAVLILAGIIFNGVVCGMLMRPLESSAQKKKKKPSQKSKNDKSAKNSVGYSKSKPIVKNKFLDLSKPSKKSTGGGAYSSVPNMVLHSTRGESVVLTKDKSKPAEASGPEAKPLVDKMQLLHVEDIVPHHHNQHRAHNLTFISEANLNKIKTELARPMYRKDIFYSGSIMNMHQFRSQPDVKDYIRSVTSIPSVVEKTSCFVCTCIPKPARDTLNEMLDVSLLKNPTFLLICLGNVTAMLGFYVPFVYIVDRAITLGIDEGKAAFLLSIIGITNTIGRIMAGFLADMRKIDSLVINNVAMLLLGVVTILAPFCVTFELLCVFATVFGLCVAAYISLTSIIICDLMGLENLTNAFGLLTLARGLASTAGPPLAGAIYDVYQSYEPAFYICGSLIIVGSLFHFLLHLPCLRKSSNKDGPITEIGLFDAGLNYDDRSDEEAALDDVRVNSSAQAPQIVIDTIGDNPKTKED